MYIIAKFLVLSCVIVRIYHDGYHCCIINIPLRITLPTWLHTMLSYIKFSKSQSDDTIRHYNILNVEFPIANHLLG